MNSDPIRARLDALDRDNASPYFAQVTDALRAVLDLHQPFDDRYAVDPGEEPECCEGIGGMHHHCEECADEPWPCPTVEAIAAALLPGETE